MHPAIVPFTIAGAVLALSALLARAMRLPALPFYLLSGLAIAPWLDVGQTQPLPDLGLLLLLFSVGMEFGPERLGTLSRRALRAGLWDALALPIGLVIGLALGLDARTALLLGGVVYISSSAVIARLIIDLDRAAYPESEVVLGVLVLEDVVITAVLALSAGQAGGAALLASVALVALYVVAARVLGPRLSSWLERLSDEPLLLLGAVFAAGSAELFHAAGASAAMGAFLAGVVAVSLGVRARLEPLIEPIRDLATALFFLATGATARATVHDISTAAVVLAILPLLIKLPLNYLSGAAAGLGIRGRVLTALYLIPRGEFTLVLGAIALRSGATLVAHTAVLMVLISVPLGALAIQAGPQLTRRLTGRRLMAQRARDQTAAAPMPAANSDL